MKQFKDYKKQYRQAFIGLALVLALLMPVVFSHAQSARELQSKIEEKNRDIEQLEAQIRQFQKELDGLAKEKNSLAGSIAELDLTRKKLTADINITQDKIDRTNLKIQGLSSQIGTKEGSISTARKAIALDIKRTNEFEQTTLIETILSDSDFTTVWTDIENMASIRQKIRDSIEELSLIKGELEDTRNETIEAKNELTVLRSKFADQKKIVEQNTAQKNTLLKQTKNSETAYQKLVADQIAKKAAIEQELRNYESQLKFILDPSTLPGGGVLGWPLDSVLVTQQFGRTVDAKRLYASGSHSGTDFRAAVGTPVKAMANGVVVGTGDTDLTCAKASFGKWILIDYGNGLSSAYGHLSLVKAQKGQRVSRGEVVAYSGNTGHSTAPHLHVSVYASNAVEVQTLPSKSCVGKTLTQPLAAINGYLDPLYYLPPTTSAMFKR